MARRSRPPKGSHEPLTYPLGPVAIATGVAELIPDPDSSSRVTLQVNGMPSSFVDLADPGFLAFEYMQIMDAVVGHLFPGSTPISALHLGAGGCTLARAWDWARPGSRQLAVDIDTSLTERVRKWFNLPRAPRLRLRAQDAADALSTAKPDSYDVVVRDVFAGDTTPEPLTTLTAVTNALAALRPGGVYLVNCADKPPLTSTRRELATLSRVVTMDSVALVAEPAILKSRRYGNLVLVAVKGAADLTSPMLARRLRTLPVPAAIVAGEALTKFIGTAHPINPRIADTAPAVTSHEKA